MEDTTTVERRFRSSPGRGGGTRLVLVVTWCGFDPTRLGEILAIPLAPTSWEWVFGREYYPSACKDNRVRLCRHLPEDSIEDRPLHDLRLRHRELGIRVIDTNHLEVRGGSRRRLAVDGVPVDVASVHPGSVLEVPEKMMFLCVRRPVTLSSVSPDVPFAHPSFGQADAWGLVGESPAMWRLRSEIASTGWRDRDVLILGTSRRELDLVARAVHACSPRCGRPAVFSSASACPSPEAEPGRFGLLEASEVADRERSGIPRERADGVTLIVGDLSGVAPVARGRLERQLARMVELRRGRKPTGTPGVRIIATSLCSSGEKKGNDSSFPVTLRIPDLVDRWEDIPLLAASLLRAGDSELSACHQGPCVGAPLTAISLENVFAQSLLVRRYPCGVQELEQVVLDYAASRAGTSGAPSHATICLSSVASKEAWVPNGLESSPASVVGDVPGATVARQALSAMETFDREERGVLMLLRRYRFNIAQCASAPGSLGDRAHISTRCQALLCRALGAARWDVEAAEGLLAGEEQHLRKHVRRRMTAFLRELDLRLAHEGASELTRSLEKQFGEMSEGVLSVLHSLDAGRGNMS